MRHSLLLLQRMEGLVDLLPLALPSQLFCWRAALTVPLQGSAADVLPDFPLGQPKFE
jgi:hypothetical protein